MQMYSPVAVAPVKRPGETLKGTEVLTLERRGRVPHRPKLPQPSIPIDRHFNCPPF